MVRGQKGSAARAAAHTVRATVLGYAHAYAPLPDLKVVAALAGAEIVERDLAAGADGCQALLIPLRDDRFRIVVDPTPRTGWDGVPEGIREDVAECRRRFRIGHELGHTLFYFRREGAMPMRRFAGSLREERFCDEFARSLLLPARVVRACRSARELVALHAGYGVSVELVARCIAEATVSDVALFYWESDQPHVQWTNVASTQRLRRWCEGVGQALKRDGDASIGAAQMIMLHGRNQALVLA
jgi:IrrE N-terminal-like domain